MEQKQLTIEELMKLVSSGKATASQKIQFAEMLSQSAKQEEEEEKSSKVALIDKFITEQGLSVDEYIKLKKPAPSTEIIWEWTDEAGKVHSKTKGSKGRWASRDWVKQNLTAEKALTYAKNEEGQKFIKQVYAPVK